MKEQQICAVITNKDTPLDELGGMASLFEVRIDLIGQGWEEIAAALPSPWIATNRLASEGGQWQESEARRKEEQLKALHMGADIIDIELATPNLENAVGIIKKTAKCLISYHNLEKTPPLEELKKVVSRQIAAGADICKVVTTAHCLEDNLTVLKLIGEFPEQKIVAFAMGAEGTLSRVLSPLAGGQFTFAAAVKGEESANGQFTVAELYNIYEMIPK